MIIAKLVSGLGNQLFQYTVGRQLALQHSVPLKLDTQFFDSQSLRGYKLDNFDIKASIASIEEIDQFLSNYNSKSLYSKLFRKGQKLLPKNKRKYFKEDEWWVFEPSLASASKNTYLEGYWQNYKYYENLDSKIVEELTLKEKLQGSAQAIAAKINNIESSVSLHVRRGDYVTDPFAKNTFGPLPADYYYNAIDLIHTKIKDPFFFIFSDDIKWVKNNLKITANYMFVEGEKDYVDLELMKNCHHNIIANSSFSWWGAFLNRTPSKIVIAPERWAIDSTVNNKIELQFPSWIKL